MRVGLFHGYSSTRHHGPPRCLGLELGLHGPIEPLRSLRGLLVPMFGLLTASLSTINDSVVGGGGIRGCGRCRGRRGHGFLRARGYETIAPCGCASTLVGPRVDMLRLGSQPLRFEYGISAGGVVILQVTYHVRCYRSRALAFSFEMNSSWSRLGVSAEAAHGDVHAHGPRASCVQPGLIYSTPTGG